MPSNFTEFLSHHYVDQPNEMSAGLVRRASIQLEFARQFACLRRNDRWLAVIDDVERSLTAFVKGPTDFAMALSDAEESLAQIGKEAKQYRIHCVGHGHIDMNWKWSWAETVSVTHDTFASVLSLMSRYPKLTYSQSQGAVYALIERYHPSMFEEIRRRVEEGRWEVTAAHWVEGDKNLASGESLCRHLMLTSAYFKDRFGMEPGSQTIDWEPDTFGHASSVPSILSQGGLKHYYCCRPGGGFGHALIGGERPCLFYWKAPDGSQILVNRESTWYGGYFYIGDNIALPLLTFVAENGLHDWLKVYGVGNHGGGPTRREIEYLLELAEWPIYPTVEFSTASRYFAAIDAEIASGLAKPVPVVDDELNFEFTGCYTSQSLIKQANRFGENYLIEAEALGAIANRQAGVLYPNDLIRDAWLKVLFSQFHDILPGSGMRHTREHALASFQEVGAVTGAVKSDALSALTSGICTASLLPHTWVADLEDSAKAAGAFEAGAGRGAGTTGMSQAGPVGNRFRPIVVFNPCAWERSERVIASLYDTGFDPAGIVVVADDGAVAPALAVASDNDWGHEKIDVAFDAVDLPSLGYRTFLLTQRTSLPRDIVESDRRINIGPGKAVTTPFLRYKVDEDRGGVVDVVDLRTGAILSAPNSRSPIGAFGYVTERPVDMSSWLLGSQIDPPVPLRATTTKLHGVMFDPPTGRMLTPAPAGVEAEFLLSAPGTVSTVRVRQSIHSLEPRIDFAAEIDWREIGSKERGVPGLIISVPLPLTSISTRYETPFGSIERSLFDGEEVPSLRYAHVEGTARTDAGKEAFAGVTLLQDCKYGHSIVGNDRDGYTLRLRVVRSSYDPDPTPEIAVTTVRFSLYFHDKPADPASLARLGMLWNSPPIVLPAAVQEGSAPVTRSYARLVSPNIALTALKLSEDGNALVLRIVELNGIETVAMAELAPELLRGATTAACVDIFERPVDGIANLSGGTLSVRIPAHSFATVRIA